MHLVINGITLKKTIILPSPDTPYRFTHTQYSCIPTGRTQAAVLFCHKLHIINQD